MKNWILTTLRSRTFWTTVATVIFNAVNINMQYIPPMWQGVVTGLLGIMIVYFHVNPSQPYPPTK